MAAPASRSAAPLFNNRTFSDVGIQQYDADGVLHRCHAHKAVLGLESEYFHQQFAGDYREADFIAVFDDDKLHFELLLKYMYTNHYDTVEIETLAGIDTIQCVLIPIGICIVAAKYRVATMYARASDDVRSFLLEDTGEFKLLNAAVTSGCE